MNKMIGLGVLVGSVLGGWLGSLLDSGSAFGLWGIIGSTIGGLVGIYAAYKISQNY